MTELVIIILLGMMCGCLLPSLTLWFKSVKEFIQRRRKMYHDYLQRFDDFEQYQRFMERCERDYQINWLLDIQAQAEQELKEFLHS